MASLSPLINELVEALTILPGVGAKSAQRLALHLLEKNQAGAHNLVNTLSEALRRSGIVKNAAILPKTNFAPYVMMRNVLMSSCVW